MAKKLSELKPSDVIVVKFAAKTKIEDGETITLDPEKELDMPKAAFDAIERKEKNGFAPALDRIVTALGTPKYDKEEKTLAGPIKALSGYEPFAKEAEESAPDSEVQK